MASTASDPVKHCRYLAMEPASKSTSQPTPANKPTQGQRVKAKLRLQQRSADRNLAIDTHTHTRACARASARTHIQVHRDTRTHRHTGNHSALFEKHEAILKLQLLPEVAESISAASLPELSRTCKRECTHSLSSGGSQRAHAAKTKNSVGSRAHSLAQSQPATGGRGVRLTGPQKSRENTQRTKEQVSQKQN